MMPGYRLPELMQVIHLTLVIGVYKDIGNRADVTNNLNENGEYLCSWLYDDGVAGIWYDRYYLPQDITGVEAEEGNLNNPPIPLSAVNFCNRSNSRCTRI